MIDVFIINRDLLTFTRCTVEWVRAVGGNPIVIDNDSSYPPLLDWYASGPCETIMLGENLGNRSAWLCGAAARVRGEYYVVTDNDLDYSTVPADVFTHLINGLHAHPWALKSGLSLEINDLPNTRLGRIARDWETKFWSKPTGKHGFYEAAIDATFAVYYTNRPEGGYDTRHGVRAGPPYTARHRPWYYDEIDNDEYRYYLEHTDRPYMWSRYLKARLPKA